MEDAKERGWEGGKEEQKGEGERKGEWEVASKEG